MPPPILYLTPIYFDVRVGRVLPEVLKALAVQRPMVVTDAQLVALGMIGRLNVSAAALYDGVETNPSESAAKVALEAYRSNACDGLVALGGGSSIDLAKAVGILLHHAPPLEQYACIRGGPSAIRGDDLPPIVAVPTTAGSGSEVGRAALITLDGGDKLALLSPKLIPAAAICDTELTLSMPPSLTAATGMDAISHCIETFCSPVDNAIADAIAIDGLERAWSHIRAATENGADRAARREMMLAALAGGLTFQKGLGAVHSLSHPMGADERLRLHHGTLNAIFLPHVLQFNLDACHAKMDAMAARIGLPNRNDLPDALNGLVRELGLPTRLSEMGVSSEDVAPLAEKAFADHSTPTNPRRLCVENCAALYAAAM